MSQKEKLITKLLNGSPFTYLDAKCLLSKLGFKLDNCGNTSGSSVRFINPKTKYIIGLHKPHDREPQLQKYQRKKMIEDLKECGEIK
jgi:hypothetical protein